MKLIFRNKTNECIKSFSLKNFESYQKIIEELRNFKQPVSASLITKNEQINKVQVFMDWAGNVSLDDFCNSLATRFAEELTNHDSKLVKGGAANETVHKYFNAVILSYI